MIWLCLCLVEVPVNGVKVVELIATQSERRRFPCSTLTSTPSLSYAIVRQNISRPLGQARTGLKSDHLLFLNFTLEAIEDNRTGDEPAQRSGVMSAP